jgi:hypothetical protein
LRADSSFWNSTLMTRLERAGWLFSISIRCQKGISEQVPAIPEADRHTLDNYPEDGETQIAKTTLGSKRLVVRRTCPIGAQAELWTDWR